MKHDLKRLLALLLCLALCLGLMPAALAEDGETIAESAAEVKPESEADELLDVDAGESLETQSCWWNFREGYTLTGDGAKDILAVAAAQVGLTEAELGYGEYWCADFLSDCAYLAGVSDLIPFDGLVSSLAMGILYSGAEYWNYDVTSYIDDVRPGDILVFGDNHICLVEYAINGEIVCIDGNWSNAVRRVIRYQENAYNDNWRQVVTMKLRPRYRTLMPDCAYSLSLSDSIDIRYAVRNLPAGTEPSDYLLRCSFRGETKEYTLESAEENVIVIADCAAKEMCDEARIELYCQGKLLKTGSYSVRGYCEALLNQNPDEKLTALLEACLDYGSHAQRYFAYRTDDLANGGWDYGDIPGVVIPAQSSKKSGSCTGILAPSFSLVLRSKTSFRVSFPHAPEAALGDYVFRVNGIPAEAADANGSFSLTIEGIAAKNLGDEVTVSVTHRDGSSFLFVSAPTVYLYAARDSAFGNLVRALYAYHRAAVEYFT